MVTLFLLQEDYMSNGYMDIFDGQMAYLHAFMIKEPVKLIKKKKLFVGVFQIEDPVYFKNKS